eukprot:COSAG02_NODE_4831_length_4927_cov_2.962096_2_plen_332_part_00
MERAEQVASHVSATGGGAAASGRQTLIKVRAVTNFVALTPDQTTWPEVVKRATVVASALVARYAALGYETQTLRIVTNPFGEYLDCSSLESALDGLAVVKQILDADDSGIRVRFAIGAARNAEELALVPQMIAHYGDLCNICVNIEADEAGLVDASMCELAAAAVAALASCTERGEGNFNFTANFACPPLIPYFPASYLGSNDLSCFAIGLEHPDLLLDVLTPLRLGDVNAAQRGAAWSDAAIKLRDAMEEHINPLVAAARDVSADTGVPFAGLDSSAAPSKDVSSMCSVFEALGVSHFGASGTVEAAAFLTRGAHMNQIVHASSCTSQPL